jgi:hypothetical protein
MRLTKGATLQKRLAAFCAFPATVYCIHCGASLASIEAWWRSDGYPVCRDCRVRY